MSFSTFFMWYFSTISLLSASTTMTTTLSGGLAFGFAAAPGDPAAAIEATTAAADRETSRCRRAMSTPGDSCGPTPAVDPGNLALARTAEKSGLSGDPGFTHVHLLSNGFTDHMVL